jgi:hypothetical protein
MLLVEPCYVGLFRVCSKNKYCRKVMLSLDLLFYSLKYLFAVVDSFCFTAQYEKKLRGLFLHFIDSNNPNK